MDIPREVMLHGRDCPAAFVMRQGYPDEPCECFGEELARTQGAVWAEHFADLLQREAVSTDELLGGWSSSAASFRRSETFMRNLAEQLRAGEQS